MNEQSATASRDDEDRRALGLVYDTSLCKADSPLTLVILVLYVPIGLLFVLLRLVHLLLIKLIVAVDPSLKDNQEIIRAAAFIFGIYTTKSKRNRHQHQQSSSSLSSSPLKIYVSNHVTCLDYLAIKSQLKCNYFTDKSSFLVNMFVRESNVKKDDDRIYSNKDHYPLLAFPETLSTNGRHALLKFDDVRPFQQEDVTVVPLCLKVSRPCLFDSFAVNYYDNGLVNLLITLFVPISYYTLHELDEETSCSSRQNDEQQLAEHVQELMSQRLGLRVISKRYTHQAILAAVRLGQRAAPAAEASAPTLGHSDRSYDQLAQQIKEILVDVPLHVIHQHIATASTLDIDTIMTSILDSPTPAPATKPQSENKVITKKKSNSNLDFATRKQMLLDEARERFLAREKNE